MNVFQTTIISLFNEREEWTVKDLRDKTQIPNTNFNGGLLQLCNPKFKVLNKEIKKPTLGEMEKISINKAFKNANIRVIVMPVPSGKDKEESRKKDEAENNEGIQRERNMIIEAHCVKQMKANKTMMYNDLLQKVMATI
jgi:hypothetical protein